MRPRGPGSGSEPSRSLGAFLHPAQRGVVEGAAVATLQFVLQAQQQVGRGGGVGKRAVGTAAVGELLPGGQGAELVVGRVRKHAA